jgi:hypothetical protein
MLEKKQRNRFTFKRRKYWVFISAFRRTENSGFFNSFDETSVKELELMKENARKVAEEKFSEEIILNKFYNII